MLEDEHFCAFILYTLKYLLWHKREITLYLIVCQSHEIDRVFFIILQL